MRSLMKADCERVVVADDSSKRKSNRDAYTVNLLRSAGVSAYESNNELKREMEVAVANADFKAKQKFNLVGYPTGLDIQTESESDEDSDFNDIAEMAGYGQKLVFLCFKALYLVYYYIIFS